MRSVEEIKERLRRIEAEIPKIEKEWRESSKLEEAVACMALLSRRCGEVDALKWVLGEEKMERDIFENMSPASRMTLKAEKEKALKEIDELERRLERLE